MWISIQLHGRGAPPVILPFVSKTRHYFPFVVMGNLSMAKKFRRFLWQFVIGFGFLSGLWTAMGINPENVIITALGSVVTTQVSDPVIRALLCCCPP